MLKGTPVLQERKHNHAFFVTCEYPLHIIKVETQLVSIRMENEQLLIVSLCKLFVYTAFKKQSLKKGNLDGSFKK